VRGDFFGAQAASASGRGAVARFSGALRGGLAGALFTDVHPGLDLFLDGAGAGDCLWLLQPVQHRADAGRGVSRRVQGGVHVRAAGAAGEQCAGARADRHAVVAGVAAAAVRIGHRLGAGVGMVLAQIAAPLHEREFVILPRGEK